MLPAVQHADVHLTALGICKPIIYATGLQFGLGSASRVWGRDSLGNGGLFTVSTCADTDDTATDPGLKHPELCSTARRCRTAVDAELAIHRALMGFHGVDRHVEPVTDFATR